MRGRDRIEIGVVARAHGIQGEIVISTHDPDSVTLQTLPAAWLGGARYAIKRARRSQRGWLVLLEGVDTRNAAEPLRGLTVEMERAHLDLAPGEYLLDDLIGCQVVLPDGRPWGVVAALELAFQDRLVIHDGDVERLLPLVPQCIVSVDVDAGTIVADPPEGIPETPIAAAAPR